MQGRTNTQDLAPIKVIAIIFGLKYAILALATLTLGPGLLIMFIGAFSIHGSMILAAEALTFAGIFLAFKRRKIALALSAIALCTGLTGWIIDFQNSWLKKFSLFEFIIQNGVYLAMPIICYYLFRRGVLS